MAELSKRTPARTETVKFNWVKLNFMEMSPEFRKIRAVLIISINNQEVYL